MEPTEFEKWCAKEMGHTIAHIISLRKENFFGSYEYRHGGVTNRYRAYTAGVTSMLPYKTPTKGATNEG